MTRAERNRQIIEMIEEETDRILNNIKEYSQRVGNPVCTRTHDLCYLGGPCPYCEKKVVKVKKKNK